MTEFSSEPRAVLRELATTHGSELLGDPRRLQGLLRDLVGAHRREVSALVVAAEEGVGSILLGVSAGLGPATADRLARRLVTERALSEEAARWAVESWAHAVGVPIDPSAGDELPDHVSDLHPPPPPAPPPPLPPHDFDPPATRRAVPGDAAETHAPLRPPAVADPPPPVEGGVAPTTGIPPSVEAAEPSAKRIPASRLRWLRRRGLVFGLTLVVVVGAATVVARVTLGGCGPDHDAGLLANIDDRVPMRGADPGNSNDFSDNAAPAGPTLERRWCTDFENSFSTLTIADGTLFANDDEASTIVAIDLRSGQRRVVFPGSLDAWLDMALSDGALFTADTDVTRHDQDTGELEWRTDPPVDGFVHEPPVALDGLVLLLFNNDGEDERSTVLAVETDTGSTRWMATIESRRSSPIGASLAVADGVVSVSTTEAVTFFDLQTGEAQGRATLEFPGPVVAADGVVVTLEKGDPLAIDPGTGSVRWRFERDPNARPYGKPAVAGGMLFVVTAVGSDLHAFNLRSGAARWTFRSGAERKETTARPSIAGDVVYFGVDSVIYAVDAATGRELWRHDTGVDIRSDLLIASGLIVFEGTDGKVHAFGQGHA